mmetsp:Transcript_42047/g.61805  ORF Transcript_42047/g.61805 Transcript_42047/m.61805 type:complete len:202 (-) Transcript_42047:500-1105(-)|eukprot:CAMPEP_0179430338 /NCGR_PEP_ID=MMETSP0799-20121207/15508_1 /TAXON_ID=46947 /ORGANISM="Geminigera cryophila, Strain CCMP2564" /LENGTH=201 /DNA_ID=CAMNT_0021206729 /DNA_START=90 /DNA_END=695 /DNA_ORIENTATION=+
MSELFGALGGLVNKVATKTEDGLQRFANKTEDVAKRVNRTVNPLSSHFRENSAMVPEHVSSSNPLAYAQSPCVDRHVRSETGPVATPGGGARREMGAAHALQHSQNSLRVEPPAIFLNEGLSSKSALYMADEILSVVTLETTKLESERDEYKHVLQQLQQLRKEQEDAYKRSEALMLEREQELRKHIETMETEKDGVTVSF